MEIAHFKADKVQLRLAKDKGWLHSGKIVAKSVSPTSNICAIGNDSGNFVQRKPTINLKYHSFLTRC